MGVIPVCALNSIKRDGIGGVANNPVEIWILRNHLVDSILSKRLAFLAEDFNQIALQGTPHHCSYRIVL
jgi:hypothetical protein